MKSKIKSILTVLLLAFAGITLAIQIAKEFRTVKQLQLADGLNVICSHATTRCPTCLAIERLTKELLAESFGAKKISFREVNYEDAEASEFASTYKMATASVVLVNVQDGKAIAGKNLANECWALYIDEPAFKKMLKEQITAMLEGREIETNDSSEEIIFDSDDDVALPL